VLAVAITIVVIGVVTVQVEKTFGKMVHSPEALYGMSCFAQKKKPDWSAFHNDNKEQAKL
jgi:hypothetical protein